MSKRESWFVGIVFFLIGIIVEVPTWARLLAIAGMVWLLGRDAWMQTVAGEET